MEVASGQFVSSVAVPVKARPRLEKREVVEGQMEVLEVVNSYLAIPVTTFSVRRMKQVEHFLRISTLRLNILSQVNIDPDESSEAFLVFSGSHIKDEQQEEEAIYISSDDEEMTRPHCVLVNPRLRGAIKRKKLVFF